MILVVFVVFVALVVFVGFVVGVFDCFWFWFFFDFSDFFNASWLCNGYFQPYVIALACLDNTFPCIANGFERDLCIFGRSKFNKCKTFGFIGIFCVNDLNMIQFTVFPKSGLQKFFGHGFRTTFDKQAGARWVIKRMDCRGGGDICGGRRGGGRKFFFGGVRHY